jgi:hypothetical protein
VGCRRFYRKGSLVGDLKIDTQEVYPRIVSGSKAASAGCRRIMAFYVFNTLRRGISDPLPVSVFGSVAVRGAMTPNADSLVPIA